MPRHAPVTHTRLRLPLQFRLLVSSTPRKGSCPVFFADGMSPGLEQLESVTIEGPILPYVALQVCPTRTPCAAAHACLHHMFMLHCIVHCSVVALVS